MIIIIVVKKLFLTICNQGYSSGKMKELRLKVEQEILSLLFNF